MAAQGSVVRLLRWGARIWGTAAALFWGAFLVEHFTWFGGGSGMPPPRIWVQQTLHFTLVASLLAAWRYERVAGTVALAASVAFFASVAGPRFWPFVAMTVPPALAFIYCGMRSAPH
jgi:hypothetical protein